jgi:hypothetical protein
MEKYNWSADAFAHRMAPLGLDRATRRPVWTPRRSLVQRLFGGGLGRQVCVDEVIVPGCFLKFCLPDSSVQKTIDSQNWRSNFDRETRYTTTVFGYIMDRWLKFLGFQRQGFDFDVEYVDVLDTGGSVVARTPTLVFCGAEWVRVAPPRP